MRANKTLRLLALCGAVALSAYGVVIGISDMRKCARNDDCVWYAFDLRLRYREMVCAHRGINTFHAWENQECVGDFTPMEYPGKVAATPKDGVRPQFFHAYPAWHTAFAWAFGWMDEMVCVSLMAMVFGLCLSFLVRETFAVCRPAGEWSAVAAWAVLSMVSTCIAYLALNLNYGLLVLTMAILMAHALKGGHDLAAGLAWSVMLIKPQLGLLFGWPLLFARRYRAIAAAAAVIAGATLFASAVYRENPVELILQVPKLGAPFGGNPFVERFLVPAVGPVAKHLWMAAFFALCGALSFRLRRSDDWLRKLAPAALCATMWTYSQPHDQVILWLWFAFAATRVFRAGPARRRWIGYLAVVAAWRAFDVGWFVLTHHSSTAGDPIRDGASGLFVAATFAMAVIDAVKAPDHDNSGPR